MCAKDRMTCGTAVTDGSWTLTDAKVRTMPTLGAPGSDAPSGAARAPREREGVPWWGWVLVVFVAVSLLRS
jgi:hypothetical protein